MLHLISNPLHKYDHQYQDYTHINTHNQHYKYYVTGNFTSSTMIDLHCSFFDVGRLRTTCMLVVQGLQNSNTCLL